MQTRRSRHVFIVASKFATRHFIPQVLRARSKNAWRRCSSLLPLLQNRAKFALQRTPAKSIAVPSCTRSAHAALQAFDIENESVRSIIGAQHNRCDKLFILLCLLTFSRSNRLLDRLIIYIPASNTSLAVLPRDIRKLEVEFTHAGCQCTRSAHASVDACALPHPKIPAAGIDPLRPVALLESSPSTNAHKQRQASVRRLLDHLVRA